MLAAGCLTVTGPAAEAAAGDLAQLTGTGGCLQEPAPNNSNPDPTCAAAFAGSLVGPERVQASADGKLVLAGSPGALLVSTRAANGTLAPAQCFVPVAAGDCAALRGLNFVNWIRFTPDDKHVYVGSGGGEIAVLDRNPTTNVLSQAAGTGSCYTTTPTSGCTTLSVRVASRDAAFAPDGSNLYIAADSGVSVLGRDTTSGALSAVQCVVDTSSGEDCLKIDNFVGGTSVAVLPDASRVVVGLSNSNTGDFAHGGLWSFTRGANGTLGLGSCLQETATTQCAAATGVRNAQSLAVDPDGTVYESGGAGNVGGVLVLDHSGSGHLTRLHCYAPSTVSGCEHVLPDGVQTPSAVALDGGFVHAVMGGSYVALTTHADHSLTIDSGVVRCFGLGSEACPGGFRPATTLPMHITAVGGTSYLASEQGKAVLAFKYPVAADLLDFTAAPKPRINFGSVPVVGNTLHVHVGTWTPTPDSFKYSWRADGDPIPGEHHQTLTLTKALWGKRIKVDVTGVKAGYKNLTESSKATPAVVRPFAKTPTPTITGTAKVGHTLTAHHGTWQPAPTFSYQWLADGKAIAGATQGTYAVKASVKGMRLTVRVTGKRDGYRTTAKTSAPTGKVT